MTAFGAGLPMRHSTAVLARSTAAVATAVHTDYQPRCVGPHPSTALRYVGKKCGRILAAYLTRPWSVDCSRCGHTNEH